VSRKPRVDYYGAIQHVAVNGNNRQQMFLDEFDRDALIDMLRDTAERYAWEVWSYCLMDTHWHLLVRSPGTLSRGMQRLNSFYSHTFNKRHARSGHSIRHKFMSVHVQHDNHLLELTRYIPLNPVRAGLASHPEDWPWSSYHQELRPQDAPSWLHADWSSTLHGSVERLRRYVDEGMTATAGPVSP
jgi:putative transposase